MTLNIAHGRGRALLQTRARSRSFFKRNLSTIAALIVRESPHVVALQEAELGSRWAGDFDHVEFLSQQCGYEHVVATPHMDEPGRFRYGTAVVSRLPFERTGGGDFIAQHRRWRKGYTFGRVRLAGFQPSCVVSLHLDFRHFSTRMAQAQELAAVLRRLTNPILAGDFNTTGEDLDDPIKTLARLNALDVACPEELAPTNRAGSHTIDWIMLPKPLGCRGLQTRRDKVSDHRAVIADVAVPLAASVVSPQP